MSEMGRVAAVAVVAALCAVLTRKAAPEFAILLALAAGAMILAFCGGALSSVLELLDELAQTGGLSQAVVAPVIKTAGIAVVTKITAEICRDAQEGGLAGAVETAGTILTLMAAVPLLTAVLSTLEGLL